MIGAVRWVPKGVAKALPDEAPPRSLEEIDEVVQGLQGDAGERSSDNEGSEDEDAMQLEGDGDEVANAVAAAKALRAGKRKETNANAVVDELAELNMDAYDDEDEEIRIFGNGGLGAAYYKLGEKDPYLIDDDDDDEDEMEDKIIKPSDLLIVVAKTEDGVGFLEVHIYEEENDHEYVHHEVLLSGSPLCLAWLDCNVNGGDKGNFIAVGSLEPDIEIWDLDASNEVKPVGVLRDTNPESSTKKTKKKKKKKKSYEMPSNSVLGLSWNYEYRNVLASGGADATVKVWDVVAQKCEKTVNCHSSKVSDVAWNPNQPTSLLSGSFDSSVVLTDMRAPADTGLRWKVSKDVECVAWNPHASHSFVVSSEDGFVCGFDVRTASTKGPNGSLFTLHAHDESAAAVSYNLAAPNLLATGSHDKTVKLWDLTNDVPALVTKTSPDVGDIFSVSFCKDSPFVLAVGGSSGQLHVWNTITDSNVAQRYSNLSSIQAAV